MNSKVNKKEPNGSLSQDGLVVAVEGCGQLLKNIGTIHYYFIYVNREILKYMSLYYKLCPQTTCLESYAR
jgi:hypothetical protein